MGLAVIMISNILLVQVNSSDYDFAFQSIKRLARDKIMWLVSFATILGLSIIIYTPANSFLKLAPLTFKEIIIVLVIASISVLWYEVVKLIKKVIKKNN